MNASVGWGDYGIKPDLAKAESEGFVSKDSDSYVSMKLAPGSSSSERVGLATDTATSGTGDIEAWQEAATSRVSHGTTLSAPGSSSSERVSLATDTATSGTGNVEAWHEGADAWMSWEESECMAEPFRQHSHSGYWGHGAPMQAVYKGRVRSIHDGGGLCSPGRWAVKNRRFPDSAAFGKVRLQVKLAFLRWTQGCDAQKVFWDLAAGKCKSSPFPAQVVESARTELDNLLANLGTAPGRLQQDRKTEINFRRLFAMLQLAGDPDFEFIQEVTAHGVKLGVDVPLPRTPSVFEEKTKWNLQWIDSAPSSMQCTNYQSATENMQDIKRQVHEELQRGTVVKMSKEEALRKFPGKLNVAALGAVPKEQGSSTVRIIHDATHKVEINNRIRVQDRLRFPIVDDLDGVLRCMETEHRQSPAPRFCLKYDVARAHKLVPVHEDDWAYQAFSLDDPEEIFMHTVGAFGLASAAYWWQRVAAAVVRLAHYLLHDAAALYHLLFADDGLLMSEGKDFWLRQLLWLFIFELLEVPLSWKKVAGGASLAWIGYQVDVQKFQKGIGASKIAWLQSWVSECLQDGYVQGWQMRGVLGRLSYIAGVLAHVRPFLGPSPWLRLGY